MDKKATQVIEVNPETLKIIDVTDRSDWTEDMYVSAGEEASKLKYYSQWVLGKLAYEYSGKKYGDCDRYARQIHIDASSLYAYRRVYRKIHEKDPNYVPDGFVPWGVLQIAAESKEPVEMLEELSANGKLSVEEAYRYRKEKETGIVVPKKPKVSLKWNAESGLWKLVMDEKDFDKIEWGDVGKRIVDYLRRLWEK